MIRANTIHIDNTTTKSFERRQCFILAALNSLKNISIFSYYFLVSSNFDLRMFVRMYELYDVATCMWLNVLCVIDDEKSRSGKLHTLLLLQ